MVIQSVALVPWHPSRTLNSHICWWGGRSFQLVSCPLCFLPLILPTSPPMAGENGRAAPRPQLPAGHSPACASDTFVTSRLRALASPSSSPGFGPRPPVWTTSSTFQCIETTFCPMVSLVCGGSEGKASAYNVGDLGSIPGLGRSPAEGNGNLLQYSCWKIPWTEEPGRLPVHGVTKSQTKLSDFTFFPEN